MRRSKKGINSLPAGELFELGPVSDVVALVVRLRGEDQAYASGCEVLQCPPVHWGKVQPHIGPIQGKHVFRFTVIYASVKTPRYSNEKLFQPSV